MFSSHLTKKMKEKKLQNDPATNFSLLPMKNSCLLPLLLLKKKLKIIENGSRTKL